MAHRRGMTGTVRGMDAQRVQKLFSRAVQVMVNTAAGVFSRRDLREHLEKAAKAEEVPYTPDTLHALEHAFFRAVVPLPTNREGLFLLPDYVEDLAKHRDYRLPGGRLALPDIMQLCGLLHHAETKMGLTLTPGLAEQLTRSRAALRELGLPTTALERG